MLNSNLTSNCLQLKVEAERGRRRRIDNEEIFSRSRSASRTPIRDIEEEFVNQIFFKQFKCPLNHEQGKCKYHSIETTIELFTYGYREAWQIVRQIDYYYLINKVNPKKKDQFHYLHILAIILKMKLIVYDKNKKRRFIYGRQFADEIYLKQNKHQFKIRRKFKEYQQQVKYQNVDDKQRQRSHHVLPQPPCNQPRDVQSTILTQNLEGLGVNELFNILEAIDKKLKTTLPGYSGYISKNQSPDFAGNSQQDVVIKRQNEQLLQSQSSELEIAVNKEEMVKQDIERELRKKQQFQSAVFLRQVGISQKEKSRIDEERIIQQFSPNVVMTQQQQISSKNKTLNDYFQNVNIIPKTPFNKNQNQKQDLDNKKFVCECGFASAKQTSYCTHIYQKHEKITPAKNPFSKSGVPKGSCGLQQSINQF